MFPELVIFPASHVIVVTAVALAWLLSLPYRAWHKETHNLMAKLSQQNSQAFPPNENENHGIAAGDLRRRIAKLPEVVQKYISEALFLPMHNKGVVDYDDERIIPMARSLRINQEGSFLLNNKWIPFTATQEFSTCHGHPGFVWDAVMKSFLPINVRDAYINGVGMMKAQLPGGIPVMNMKDREDLNLGELMRWMAEAVLFPMALIPKVENEGNGKNRTVLKWLASEEGSDDCAAVEIQDRNTVAKVHFHFDPTTHMITKIHAMRPRVVDGVSENVYWEGSFYEYEVHGGLLVPTRMEVGWQVKPDEPVELYFRGKNSNFIYLVDREVICAERGVIHAHMD
ncbi:hypothetical protein ACHAXS_005562 [Conticribra weissflogii]